MITTNYCNVQAIFDTGTFMYFGVSTPLKEHQYTCNIQDEYNLSFEDFTALEIMIASVVDRYIKHKKDQNDN
jgi:hypothetical protein